jgi:rhodanese-related sulfurtransferase
MTEIARVAPHAAHALVTESGYVYLDVRSAEEFALGHPLGAFNLPLTAETARGTLEDCEFVRVARARFALDTKFVVGCAAGKSSPTAARMLAAAGYAQIVELSAGFDGRRDAFGRVLERGWRALGLPQSTEALPEHDYAALLARARASD